MNKSQIRPDISRVSDATAIKKQIPKTNTGIRNLRVIPMQDGSYEITDKPMPRTWFYTPEFFRYEQAFNKAYSIGNKG